MKVLSVRQPWAWLIVAGYKDVENRTWNTRYRRKLFIHAPKTFDLPGWSWVSATFPAIELPTPGNYATGAIIGSVELYGMMIEPKSLWFEGPWGWRLRYQNRLPVPIPCKGKLGIWEYVARDAVPR